MSIKEELERLRNKLKMLNTKEKIVIILLFISLAGFITGHFIIDIDDVKGLLITRLSFFFGGLVFYLFPDTTFILFMKDEPDRIFIEDRLNKKDVNKVFKGAGIIAMFCQVPVITLTLFSYDVPFVLRFISILFIGSFALFLDMAFDSELLKYVSANELTLIHIMAIVVSTALTWMTLVIFNLPVNLPAGFIGIEIMVYITAFGLLAMPVFLSIVGSRQLLKLRKKRRGEQ